MHTVSVTGLAPGKDDLSFELNSDEIIYEGLERQGLELAHGCLAGSCGVCKVEIIEGINNLKPAGAVETDTINHVKNSMAKKTGDESFLNKNIRLSCRARISGPIKISCDLHNIKF